MPDPLELLRCPRTLAPLIRTDDGLATKSGDVTYELRRDIADLRVEPERHSPLPLPEKAIQELLAPCTPEQWPQRIRDFLEPLEGHRGWLKNLVDDSRFAWQTLSSPARGGTVLEIGCGFGAGSLRLAKIAERLVALDLSPAHLAFTQLRLETFAPGADVTYVAGGDGARLPFAEHCFDRVLLYGGLDAGSGDDWPLADARGRLPRAELLAAFVHRTGGGLRQAALLEEIRRVLKPGGQLLYAADNGLDHLLHSRLLRRVSGRRLSLRSIWRHALPHYRRSLDRAGFGPCSVFSLSPAYNSQTRLTPLENEPTFWSKPTEKRPFGHRLRAPGYGIRAATGAALPQSLLDELVEAAATKLVTPLSVSDCMVSGKGKVVLLASTGARPIVVKLTLSAFAAETESANWAFLEALEQSTLKLSQAYAVPRPLARGTLREIPFYVESRCPGVPLGELLLKHGRDHQSGDVAQLFLDMNPDLDSHAPADFDEALFEALVGRPMRRLKQTAGDQWELLQRVEERLRSRLLGMPIRTGVTHGDLSVNNIFADGQKVTGAIDWVSATTKWPPLFDVMCYHLSLDRLLNPKVTARERLGLLSTGSWPEPRERELIALHANRMALPPGRLADIAYTYWISHTEGQLDYLLAFDARAFKARVLDVLGDYLALF